MTCSVEGGQLDTASAVLLRPMNHADVLAAEFRDAGIRQAFGQLGDSNLRFMSALDRLDGMQVTHARHENNAVAMAAGAARLGEGPALAVVTCGPGLTHAISSLIHAARAHLPMVVYAGDIANTNVGPDSLQQLKQSDVALLGECLFGPVRRDMDPAGLAQRAVSASIAARKPVVFSVPTDWAETDHRADRGHDSHGGWLSVDDTEDRIDRIALNDHRQGVDRVVEAINSAKNPLLVIGPGGTAPNTVQQIRNLAEVLDAGIAVTFAAKGCLENEHRFIGVFGPFAHPAYERLQQRADLIVGIGADVHGFGCFGDFLFETAKLCLGPPKDSHSEAGSSCGVDLPLDALLSDTVARLQPRSHVNIDSITSVDIAHAMQEDLEGGRLESHPYADPRRAFRALDLILPEDGHVVIGGGHFWSFPIMYLQGKHRTFHFPIEFGSIGMALPTGIGIARALPDSHVVVIEGDGGLLSSLSELETIGRYQLPMTVVVVNDGALGAEYHKLNQQRSNPAIAAYEYVEFDKIAAALGFESVSFKVDPCESAWSRLIPPQSSSPRLLDLRVSRSVISRWYRRAYGGRSP